MDGWVDPSSFEGAYKCECIGCAIDKCVQQWALWQYSVIWMDLFSDFFRGGVELGGVRKESIGLASDSPPCSHSCDDTPN
jgi:hypothetical protein